MHDSIRVHVHGKTTIVSKRSQAATRRSERSWKQKRIPAERGLHVSDVQRVYKCVPFEIIIKRREKPAGGKRNEIFFRAGIRYREIENIIFSYR